MTRIVTARSPKRAPAKRKPPPPSAAIVTPQQPRPAAAPAAIVRTKSQRSSVFGDAPEMTLEEHKRRGDAAEALFRELVRRAARDG